MFIKDGQFKLESYKSFPFELKQVDENGIFEGYAAVFGNVDSWGDILEQGAFTKTLSKRANRIKICYQHNPMQPIGVPLELREDTKGLYIKGKISQTTLGKDVLQLMRDGVITELSIGYNTIKYEMDGPYRRLKEVELWEISPVTWAANELALITSVKTATSFADLPLADEGTKWDAGAARSRVAKWASSDGSGDKDTIDWKKFGKAFFWYDSNDQENFGSYKLPFADVINSKLVAVPAGIYAAAAAIQGARGGVDIPDSDIAAVKSHIEKYYKKMGKEPPWNKKFDDMTELVTYMSIYSEQIANEFKVGKVISKANLEKLKAALAALQEVIALAEEVSDDEAKALLDNINALKSIFKGGNC